MDLYLDKLSDELIINILLIYIKPSKYEYLKNVSQFLYNILTNEFTFSKLLNIMYPNVNLKLLPSFRNNNNKIFNFISSNKIVKIFKYNNYLFDSLIDIQYLNSKSLTGADTIAYNFEYYMVTEQPNHILIMSKQSFGKKIIYTINSTILLNDVNRKSFHIVKINDIFVLRYIKYEKGFGIYEEYYNIVLQIIRNGNKFAVKYINNYSKEKINELIIAGKYI